MGRSFFTGCIAFVSCIGVFAPIRGDAQIPSWRRFNGQPSNGGWLNGNPHSGVWVYDQQSYLSSATPPVRMTINGFYVGTGPQNCYAGQPMTFAVRTNLIDGTITYSWSITGCIKNYVTGKSGYQVNLLPADLSSAGFSCYPIIPGNNTATCNISVKASDGTVTIYSVSGNFNVIKPTGISLVPTVGTVAFSVVNGTASITIGDQTTPGITITPVGGPPIKTQIGTFDWCQILHTYNTTVLGITQASLASPPELDTYFPYKLPNQPFNDSPDIQGGLLGNLTPPPLSIDFDATTYLMWNCGVSGAIWVPIDSLDWKASGAELRGHLTSATQPTVSNPQNDTLVQPAWDDTLKLH